MNYPLYEETTGPLDKPEALLPRADYPSELKTAIRVAELLVSQDIERKKRQAELLLSKTAFLLPDHPIDDVLIEDHPVDFDPRLGRIYPDLPPSTYTVSYEVGYETGNLPAVFKFLLQNLILYRVTGDEQFREQAIAEIEVIRIGRERSEQERRHGEAG